MARNHFLTAGNAGHPKALYQLGKMFEKGIGLKKNLAMVLSFYYVSLYFCVVFLVDTSRIILYDNLLLLNIIMILIYCLFGI